MPPHSLCECLRQARFACAADPLKDVKLAHGQPGNEQLNIFETEMQCCTVLRLGDPVLQFNREFFQVRNVLLRQTQLLDLALLDPVCIGC
ncbi:hypothetical protein D3C85_1378030 [compost metagenome]